MIEVITRIDDRSVVIRSRGYHDPRSAWKQKLLRKMAEGDVEALAKMGFRPLDVEAEESMQDALQSGLNRCEGL